MGARVEALKGRHNRRIPGNHAFPYFCAALTGLAAYKTESRARAHERNAQARLTELHPEPTMRMPYSALSARRRARDIPPPAIIVGRLRGQNLRWRARILNIGRSRAARPLHGRQGLQAAIPIPGGTAGSEAAGITLTPMGTRRMMDLGLAAKQSINI